jgi:alkylation response protein AidB-like acyl-CoA dehydrogenase
MSHSLVSSVHDLAPPPSDWLSVAGEVASRLRTTAVEREQVGRPPRAEIELLRDAGLLTLLNPRDAGGGGARFTDAFRVTRIIARADSSIAQILSYYYRCPTVHSGVRPRRRARSWFAIRSRIIGSGAALPIRAMTSPVSPWTAMDFA